MGSLSLERHHHHQEPVVPGADSPGGLTQRPQLGQGFRQASGTLPPTSRRYGDMLIHNYFMVLCSVYLF